MEAAGAGTTQPTDIVACHGGPYLLVLQKSAGDEDAHHRALGKLLMDSAKGCDLQ